MANWDRDFSNGSNFSNWNGRLVYVLNGQNVGANTSNISLQLLAFSDNSAYSQSGLWDGRIYVNYGQVERQTPTKSISNTPSNLCGWTGNVSHDVNGNCYVVIGDYINAPVNEMTTSHIGWTLPRLALAPTISSLAASNVKQKTATITTGISSHGHGTSTTVTTYYRISGVGSYVSAGTGDTKNLTGLKPGTTYQYYVTAVNNNGDTSTSSVQTFETQGISAIGPLLMGLLG